MISEYLATLNERMADLIDCKHLIRDSEKTYKINAMIYSSLTDGTKNFASYDELMESYYGKETVN